MADWPDFDPVRQIETLASRGVDFVLIGGFAAVTHGSPRLTQDLDVSYATDRANLDALAAALDDLRARLRGIDDDVPFVPDADTLRRTSLLTLDTDAGPLDLLAEPPGGPGYDRLRRNAERVDIGGVAILIASIADLIDMKRAAGRMKDLADIEELEAIQRLRSARQAGS